MRRRKYQSVRSTRRSTPTTEQRTAGRTTFTARLPEDVVAAETEDADAVELADADAVELADAVVWSEVGSKSTSVAVLQRPG